MDNVVMFEACNHFRCEEHCIKVECPGNLSAWWCVCQQGQLQRDMRYSLCDSENRVRKCFVCQGPARVRMKYECRNGRCEEHS
eukprot:630697-Amphidinium_carterae.1